MLVTIGSYDICDGTLTGGVAIGNGRVQMDRVFDVVIPVDQLDPTLFDRVCRRINFTFEVQVSHADADSAEQFILDLDGNLPSSGMVKLTPTNSTSYRYIPNGVVTTHQTQQTGSLTATTYTIVGGQPTSTPP